MSIINRGSIALLFSLLAIVQVWAIVPQPRKYTKTAASFLFSEKCVWEFESEEQAEIATPLIESINRAAGFSMPMQIGASKASKGVVRFSSNSDIDEEGYRLIVESKQITIEASNRRGFYYALQSLRQLLPASIESATAVQGLPIVATGCIVEDWPELKVRAVRLSSSSRELTKDELLKFIDLLSIFKINRLYWDEVADRVYPLSRTDIHDIGNYASLRAVEISNDRFVIDEQLIEPTIDNTVILQPENGSRSTLKDIYDYKPGVGLRYSDQVAGLIGSVMGDENGLTSYDLWQAFPNIVALSEIAWSDPESKNWGDFLKRLDQQLPQLKAMGVDYSRSMYKLHYSTRVRDGKVLVNVGAARSDLRVAYTLEGSAPIASSQPMPSPMVVTSPTTIFAIAFQGDQEVSDPLLLEFMFNKATAKPIFSPRVSVPSILVDGLKGVGDSQEGWLVVTEPTQMVTIDLQEMTRVAEIRLGAIGLKRLEVLYSTDGAMFKTTDIAGVDINSSYHRVEGLGIECRFLKLILHGGVSQEEFMMIDEIEIY
ncbi:MAG: glycoside hydrolase family 20 zincin-like fold domain-containing protein [Bacteroidales bacterium]